MINERHYWLHRVSHEGGLDILKNESVLTIGFSAVAASDVARTAIMTRDYEAFCRAYTDVYKGAIARIKSNLWRFVVEMEIGDVVVVPCPWGFYVCEICGKAILCKRDSLDLGWERSVRLIGDVLSPRELYARVPLLSRMKCRQTNLCIDDLKDEVDSASKRIELNLVHDVSDKLLEKLREHGSPESLEEFVASVFESMGAEVEILPKYYRGKSGDCDVEATFPALHLVVSVQCKRHDGQTDNGVKQISEYAARKRHDESEGWSHWRWVVSTADRFSYEAEEAAKAKNVRLIAGKEFARMLLNAGIRG